MKSCWRATLAVPALLLAVLWTPDVPARAAGLPRLELIASDRSITNTTRLPVAIGKWIFVYIRAQHYASEQLLARLSGNRYLGVPEHMVIVLGGVSGDRLAGFAARYPKLAGALWYADPIQQTGPALKLGGTPIILGVDNQEITWSLNGLPRSDRWTQSMFATWVKQRGP